MKDRLRHLELINLQLDGALTPSEQDELNRALQLDPGLRQVQLEYAELSDRLAAVEVEGPPSSLRTSVLTTIRSRQTGTLRETVGHLLQTLFQPRFGWIMATSAAVVVLCAVLVVTDDGVLPADSAGLAGTMAVPSPNISSAALGEVSVGAYRGEFKLQRATDQDKVELQVSSQGDAEIVVVPVSAGTSLVLAEGLESGNLPRNTPGNGFQFLSLGATQARLTWQTTQQRPEILVRVNVDGRTVGECLLRSAD